MSSDVVKADVDTTKDTKADKAAKNLKPTKGKELTPGTSSKTRPPSTVSVTQSMATSFSRQDGRRVPEIAMENTFKMTPDRKFPEGDVRSILKEILTERLAEAKYDADQCRQLSKTISDTVKNRVKDLNIQRYKIICLVHIGQLGNQAMRIGSRCLWDTNYDTFASLNSQTGRSLRPLRFMAFILNSALINLTQGNNYRPFYVHKTMFVMSSVVCLNDQKERRKN